MCLAWIITTGNERYRMDVHVLSVCPASTPAAMPAIGKVEPFNSATSDWTEYHKHVELYFAANDIAATMRTAMFPTCCGSETYSLLQSLLTPTKPADTTLAVMFEALNKHYSPKVS
ncbi:hypothetical protein ISCGN_008583 [Ixodes scapularis]